MNRSFKVTFNSVEIKQRQGKDIKPNIQISSWQVETRLGDFPHNDTDTDTDTLTTVQTVPCHASSC